MQSNVILYLPIKINVLWLHCIHMLPHPKAVQLLWLEKRKQASYWQCTIQEQSGSPQESHLISSSLHVINLPAQCYCSAGHFSSFRDRGIDQVRTVSIVHLCVLWVKSLHNTAFLPQAATEEKNADAFRDLPASWLISTSTSYGLMQVVMLSTYQ